MVPLLTADMLRLSKVHQASCFYQKPPKSTIDSILIQHLCLQSTTKSSQRLLSSAQLQPLLKDRSATQERKAQKKKRKMRLMRMETKNPKQDSHSNQRNAHSLQLSVHSLLELDCHSTPNERTQITSQPSSRHQKSRQQLKQLPLKLMLPEIGSLVDESQAPA